MTTTWTIAVDWDRDGDYSDTYDDVSDRVISANWFLGMRKAYEDVAHDSMLELTLNNSDRRYSPEYTSSPLWDSSAGLSKVQPFRTVRIQSNDGTTTRTHWVGWIEKVEPAVNAYGERTVKLTAAGVLVFFEAAETDIELQENQRTDEIIAKLISEVVIPPALAEGWFLDLAGYSEIGVSTWLADTTAFSALDEGQVTLAIAADNWVQRGGSGRNTFDVYRAIADMVAAERGRFFFDREGKAVFWNRLRLQDEITSSLTLDNDMLDLSYSYAGIEDFKNEVVVNCHPRTIGETTEVLWRLTEPIQVKASERRQVNVKFQDEDTGNARIGAKDVAVTDVVFSKGTGTVTIEAKANSALLEIINTDETKPAELSAATVTGLKITDYGQMEAQAQDGLSIARYGRRRMKLNLGSVDNLDYAQAIADREISLRSEPRGMVRQVTLKSHGTHNQGHHADQLALTIGDVITIRENQTQHGVSTMRRYVIVGEAHRLSAGQTLWETTWYLERAAEAPFPWKLGVEGRGELDEAAYLAF
jgi:hypothetical protein